MRKIVLLLFSSLLLLSCKNSDTNTAQKIVDQAIDVAGGSKFLLSTISFDFRDRHYIAKRNDGMYSYQRIYIDSTNTTYHDFLSNDGFIRKIDDVVAPTDSMSVRYARSTNSVLYFALLPYGLNDDAVKKEFIGESQIESESYFKIKVTFGEDGGGEDHDDEFIYWIHQDSFRVDYFGYSYSSDGGGLRFRQAVNPRKVEGILFQDYINYKPEDESIPVDSLEALFLTNQLEEMSSIELKNIQVTLGAPVLEN
jgi:hypothetical protein